MGKFLGEFDEVWVDDLCDGGCGQCSVFCINDICIGDIVKCVDNSDGYIDLTIGRKYKIVDICKERNNFYFKVLGDCGDNLFYVWSMFKKVDSKFVKFMYGVRSWFF